MHDELVNVHRIRSSGKNVFEQIRGVEDDVAMFVNIAVEKDA